MKNQGIKFSDFPPDHQKAFLNKKLPARMVEGREVRPAEQIGSPRLVKLPAGMKLYKFNEYPSLNGSSKYGDPPWSGDPTFQDNRQKLLYRINNIIGKHVVSPWWSPYNSYEHDAGWEEKVKIAKQFRINVKEWGRLTSAVKENWNSLSNLLVIYLKADTYCYFGGFTQMARIDKNKDGVAEKSKQKADEGKLQASSLTNAKTGKKINVANKSLPGGASQFYIPYLTPEDIQRWESWPL